MHRWSPLFSIYNNCITKKVYQKKITMYAGEKIIINIIRLRYNKYGQNVYQIGQKDKYYVLRHHRRILLFSLNYIFRWNEYEHIDGNLYV